MITMLFLAPMLVCVLALVCVLPFLVLAIWRSAEAPVEASVKGDWSDAIFGSDPSPTPSAPKALKVGKRTLTWQSLARRMQRELMPKRANPKVAHTIAQVLKGASHTHTEAQGPPPLRGWVWASLPRTDQLNQM